MFVIWRQTASHILPDKAKTDPIMLSYKKKNKENEQNKTKTTKQPIKKTQKTNKKKCHLNESSNYFSLMSFLYQVNNTPQEANHSTEPVF